MSAAFNPAIDETILVGEDEPEVRSYLSVALRCHGYRVEFAEDGNEVVSYLRNPANPVSALLLDILMPRKDGIQALRELRQFNRDLPVIMLSSAASPLHVVEAMKSGATDFLAKPVTHEDLCQALQKVLNGRWNRIPPAESEPPVTVGDGAFCAGTGASREREQFLRMIGPTDVPVLIQGETGTGKEVVARYLHAHSLRASKPFLKLNCAALPSELVESELFGYERGAFTGAFQRKAGMFELADGGTLLLDEIGDMDFKLQAKLLQVLQDQSFQHLGGKETVRVNVRVLAATHRDLEAAIAEGKFREDLYYRLNVITIPVPSLRDRKDEIIPLAEFLMARHSAPGMGVLPLFPDLRQAMLDYEWPGNVRELENAMRRYLIVRDANALSLELRLKSLRRRGLAQQPGLQALELREEPSAAPVLERVSRAKAEAEREAILAALRPTHWNRKQAAALLGIDYKALLYKMRKLSIEQLPGTQSTVVPSPRRVRHAASANGRLQEFNHGKKGVCAAGAAAAD